MIEVEVMSMEDMAMGGRKIEDKARKVKEDKRRKLRKLKKLAGIDQWENEDELDITEVTDKIKNLLKFFQDPLVKSQFAPADFKQLNNGLVDAVKAIDNMEMMEDDKLLKKV